MCSLNIEPPLSLRVAYQGEPGAYSEQAARKFFHTEDPHCHPCPNFADMFTALSSGLVDRAAVPIENSLAGTIHENLDLLLRHPSLTIVGEIDFAVRHCLIALPSVKMSDIRVVRSHPMALAQCVAYLKANSLKSEVAYDTAGSAKLIHKEGATDVAAIASVRAAEIYGLHILADAIQDEPKNYTRFLILARQPSPYVPGLPSKTSLAFCLINSPGILCRALSVFSITNIDMTKIESRHVQTVKNSLELTSDKFKEDNVDVRWGYVFYVDIARHAEEQTVAAALNHLKQITTFYRVLGSYPAHISNTPLPK